MPTPIPLAKPDITAREIDAVVDVLQQRHALDRPPHREFERPCAKVAGRRHAVGVSAGRPACTAP